MLHTVVTRDFLGPEEESQGLINIYLGDKIIVYFELNTVYTQFHLRRKTRKRF